MDRIDNTGIYVVTCYAHSSDEDIEVYTLATAYQTKEAAIARCTEQARRWREDMCEARSNGHDPDGVAIREDSDGSYCEIDDNWFNAFVTEVMVAA